MFGATVRQSATKYTLFERNRIPREEFRIISCYDVMERDSIRDNENDVILD